MPGALLLGLGSMLGTGVFVSIVMAIDLTGPNVLPALVLAAAVAACNALNSAQLAAAHPISGGTYEYAYRLVSPTAGFTAGWMFLCAKTASAASAALAFAGYFLAILGQDNRSMLVGIAMILVILFTALICSGLRRTMTANAIIVSATIATLVAFVIGGILTAFQDGGSQTATEAFRPLSIDYGAGGDTEAHARISNFFYAGALLFVAYTGYGRIATMGEEVHHPRKTIPRAIIITLIVTLVLYVAVAWAALQAGGVLEAELSEGTVVGEPQNSVLVKTAPLAVAAAELAFPYLDVIVSLGAMTAAASVLLNLLLGLSRVWLAMGRRADMPPALARLAGEPPTPRIAVITAAIFTLLIILPGDLWLAWSFSAFTVLIYYSLTNMSALKIDPDHRLYPKWIAWAGLAGCLTLASFVPWYIWMIGVGLIIFGLIWQGIARARRRGEQA